ncbi:MAG: SPOR domain-containing protein [Nitrosomonadaceae bacterium]|nr:SPOR domain-containing protein [Nitrosomonadaceae bacterium]
MARIKNEQDLLLRKRARRRVVGSVVLVIIAIIFLPMILERVPEQEGKEVEIIIHSENLLDKSSEIISQNKSVEGTVPVSVEPNTGSNDSQEIIIKLEQLTEKEKAENNHKDKKSIITIEKFVVQLGAFSDATKAKNQQRSLESNGIKKAYTEMIKNENIKVTRVRVGPFSTREAAEKEQKKLKELGVNGVVINR